LTTDYICRLVDSEDADIMVFTPLHPIVRCRECRSSTAENAHGCYCDRFKVYRDPSGFCDKGVARS